MYDPQYRSNLLRALAKTFSLGRLFGFEIRIHWTIFFYFLFALRVYGDPTQPQDGRIGLVALCGVLMLFSIVTVHELGHAFAARRRGIEVKGITLSPIGGAAWMGRAPSPEDELIVTIWGPAVHPVMILAGVGPYLMVKSGALDVGYYGNVLVYQFLWLNVSLLVFNLLPSFPMDGGRILRAILARRMHPCRATFIAATIGKIASVLFIVVGITWIQEYWIIWIAIGIHNFLICQQELMIAREESPYEQSSFALGGYEPSDGEYASPDEPKEKPGPIRRFFVARAERQRAREALDEAELKQHVDDLLEKVSEVGMEGLTEDERRFLEEASNHYRKL